MSDGQRIRGAQINGTLLDLVSKVADREYDGHLTIYRFTTGWKVLFGTPMVFHDDRCLLQDSPNSMTLDQALEEVLMLDPGHRDEVSEPKRSH